jgi:hypothetical protein
LSVDIDANRSLFVVYVKHLVSLGYMPQTLCIDATR